MAEQIPAEYIEPFRVRGFELKTAIGSGGSGTVFRAYQLSLDRDVAVKVFDNPFAVKSAALRKRFEREAKLLGRVSHQAPVSFANNPALFAATRIWPAGLLTGFVRVKSAAEVRAVVLRSIGTVTAHFAASLGSSEGIFAQSHVTHHSDTRAYLVRGGSLQQLTLSTHETAESHRHRAESESRTDVLQHLHGPPPTDLLGSGRADVQGW